MRRMHAILVILALLATPMALLARSDCNQTACNCMCDLVNRTLLAQGHRAPLLCGGQAGGSMHHCTMNTKHHPPDYGLNTLMAPTAPLPVASLAASFTIAQIFVPQMLSMPSGFVTAPFEPPRS
jgi:hypothetical protein